MASVTIDRKLLPDNAQSIADQIEKLGFKWSFNYQYPLPEPENTQRVQVRSGLTAPKSEVKKYEAAMKRGDVFPPGVVTKDNRFVDFHSRALAAWNTGRRDYPAFILDVSFETATETERERLLLLGGAFNTHGPKPLTRAELVELIRQIKGADWTAEKVAAHLGITMSLTRDVFAQRKAEERAERLGVPLNGSLTASSRTLLGQRGENLNDQPFAAIAKLAQDAGLTGEELRDLCNRVKAVSGSDDERIALIESERQARGAQIANYKATAKRTPPLSSDILKRTRYIESFAGNVSELIDYNPNTGASYLVSVERAAQVLFALAAEQRTENERAASV